MLRQFVEKKTTKGLSRVLVGEGCPSQSCHRNFPRGDYVSPWQTCFAGPPPPEGRINCTGDCRLDARLILDQARGGHTFQRCPSLKRFSDSKISPETCEPPSSVC